MDRKSQKTKILEYMKTGKNINPKIAEKICNTMRLAARISDLRKDGHVIGSSRVTIENGTWFSQYWLVKEAEANE